MAVQSPPYALQNGQHSAALFRQAASANVWSAGVLGTGELAVTAQSTPNMSVQVAAGRAWITGTQVAAPSGFTFTTQARYFALNDAALTVTIAAADPTNPRIDVVYIAVQDAAYSGSNNQALVGVVTGTPAATPAVPALPNNALALANVAVAANATQVTTGNITSVRYGSLVTPQLYTCTSTTRPTGVWAGFEIYETDTGRVMVWTGTAWTPPVAQQRCTVYDGAGGQSIPNAAFTAVNFTTDAVDPYGMWASGSPSRVTITAAGDYLVSGCAVFAINSTGGRMAIAWRNGAAIAGTASVINAGGLTTLFAAVPTTPAVVTCAAGDYLQLAGYQTSGGALATGSGSGQASSLTVVRVG